MILEMKVHHQGNQLKLKLQRLVKDGDYEKDQAIAEVDSDKH
jgi:hypothetical protein